MEDTRTREEVLMDIIEYSNDANKRAEASMVLSKMRPCKGELNTVFGRSVEDVDTVDIRDILQVF